MLQRIWLRTLLLITLIGLLACYLVRDQYERQGPLTTVKTIIVQKGDSVTKIASYLSELGVVKNAIIFRLGVKFHGLSAKLRAGEYAIPARASMRTVVSIIVSGNTFKRRLTIAEGLLSFQVIDLVRKAPGLIGKLKNATVQEGMFLPETYFYSYGDRRQDVLVRMRSNLKKQLARIWNLRPFGSMLKSSDQALILASIIEKETARKTERAHISGVFHNRLRLGMPLQSDPTVAFAVTSGRSILKRRLTKDDLRRSSPFNTYLNKGLPPMPIANAGFAAIRAAILPMRTLDLYFVANGKGGHAFARTLKGHNRNVKKWRELNNNRKPKILN